MITFYRLFSLFNFSDVYVADFDFVLLKLGKIFLTFNLFHQFTFFLPKCYAHTHVHTYAHYRV